MRPAKRLSPAKQDELVAKLQRWQREAEMGNAPTFKRMSRAERFKIGDQWDPEVLEYNKAHNKISLKINKVLPTVNFITGQQIQNPRDVKVIPLRRASEGVAKVKSALVKHCIDSADAARAMSDAFDQGVTTGRGWFGLIVSFDDDIQNGDIEIRHYDAFSVLPDPTCVCYDLNDPRGGAQYVRVEEWIAKEKVEGEYPAKKQDLVQAYYNLSRHGDGVIASISSFMFGRDGALDIRDSYRDVGSAYQSDTTNGVDKANSCYRVATVWWRDYVKGGYLVRANDPLERMPLTGKALRFAKQAVEQVGEDVAQVVEQKADGTPIMVAVMNRTIHVGDCILEHREDVFNGVAMFPLVRFAPYFDGSYEYGVVENLIGPQEQMNWSWSMECNLIKQLANTGWKIARGAGSRIKEFLRDHGSEDGIVLDESDAGGRIEKIEPTTFPASYDVLTERGSRHIQEIANVRLENPEFDKRQMSGRAIALKQQSSFTGSAPLFAKWDRTLEIFARTLVAILDANDVYSDDEIRAVLDESDLIDTQMLQRAKSQVGQMLAQRGLSIPQDPPAMPVPQVLAIMEPATRWAEESDYQMEMAAWQRLQAGLEQIARPMAVQMLMAEMKKRSVGKYGTKVTLSPQAETFRMAQAVGVMEMHETLVKTGQPGISRRKLIEVSNLPDKEELIADVPQAMLPQAQAGVGVGA